MERRKNRTAVLLALQSPAEAGQLAHGFAFAGTTPALAFSAPQILHFLQQNRYRLLVLDSDLADGETVSLVRSVLSGSETPIMVLCSAQSDHQDPAADLVIPSNTPHQTIVDRGLSLIRVSQPVDGLCMRWGPLELDVGRRQARWKAHALELTPLQFRIMEVMVLVAGGVVTHAELSRRLWGASVFDDSERVQAHIRRIRQKIEINPARPSFLLTVRGEGYRLADQVIIEPDIDLAALELAAAL